MSGRDDRRPRYHPVVDAPGPVPRLDAWHEYATIHGEDGDAFAMFLLAARAHTWLAARGYVEETPGTVPTEKGHALLRHADGYEKYRTGGKA